MSGKGDTFRPVDKDTYTSNWDKIFGSDKKEKEEVYEVDEPFHVKNAKELMKRQEEWEIKNKKKK